MRLWLMTCCSKIADALSVWQPIFNETKKRLTNDDNHPHSGVAGARRDGNKEVYFGWIGASLLRVHNIQHYSSAIILSK